MFATVALSQFVSESWLSASAQPAGPDRLAQITSRGRALAEYDDACWKATDSMMASGASQEPRRFFARKMGNAWQIVFGKPSPDRRSFAIDYEAVWTPGTKNAFARKLAPPRIDNAGWANYSRALDTALTVYKPQRGTNYAILQSPNGYLVYFYPGSTEPGTWLLGGDMRYLISPDATKIIESRQMHKSVIPYSAEPGKTIAMGFHTAIVDNVPEDTDVFHVLARRPAVPELIVTRDYVYKVATNGVIRYIGTAGDLHDNKLNVDD